MGKLKPSSITAKRGINFIKSLVEESGSIFHKIEQENDFGIDCIIEFFLNGSPTNTSIAYQIKSGKSYFSKKRDYAFFQIEDHRDYWSNYSLPVHGIVYDDQNDKAYWIDIKKYLHDFPNDTSIKIFLNRTNIIEKKSFSNLFLPQMIRKIPELTIEESIELFKSDIIQEHSLGSSILFSNYKNEKVIWDIFIDYITSSTIYDISSQLIYYIAHVPGHPDIFYTGTQLTDETRNYAKILLANIPKKTIIKLLEFINPEIGIQRGSIGQSVEAIINCNSNKIEYLREIIADETIHEETRSHACILLIYFDKRQIDFLEKYRSLQNIKTIIDFVKEFGGIDLYI